MIRPSVALDVNPQTFFAKFQEIKRIQLLSYIPLISFLSPLVSKSLRYLYSLFSSSLKDMETVGNIQKEALSLKAIKGSNNTKRH